MWKNYRKTGITEMRPYLKGEDLSGVSVSPEDKQLDSLIGGMIARNPINYKDQWYVNQKFFEKNYEEV